MYLPLQNLFKTIKPIANKKANTVNLTLLGGI